MASLSTSSTCEPSTADAYTAPSIPTRGTVALDFKSAWILLTLKMSKGR